MILCYTVQSAVRTPVPNYRVLHKNNPYRGTLLFDQRLIFRFYAYGLAIRNFSKISSFAYNSIVKFWRAIFGSEQTYRRKFWRAHGISSSFEIRKTNGNHAEQSCIR